MFQWIKNRFRSKLKYKVSSIEYNIEKIEKENIELRDELIALKKLTTPKPSILIKHPYTFSFFSDLTNRKDQRMEDERIKCRTEGYQFCHKYANGDEIWAKY